MAVGTTTLVLDEEAHEYRLNGAVLPGVTNVLKHHSLIPNFPSGPYKTRGKAIHTATQKWDEGYDVKPGAKIAGYLESYKKVLMEYRFEWLEIEDRRWHPTLLYAGTIDRYGQLIGPEGIPVGNKCIADIKSGETGDETDLQTAAYAMLIDPVHFRSLDRYKIRLYEDGSAGKVTRYTNPFAFEAWVGYLNTYKWEQKGKK